MVGAEAAGGGEKSTNAELCFQRHLLDRTHSLSAADAAGPAAATANVRRGVSAFYDSSRAFGPAIFNPYSPEHASVTTHCNFWGFKKCYCQNDNKLRMAWIHRAMIKNSKHSTPKPFVQHSNWRWWIVYF